MLVRVSSPLYDRDNNLVITQITIGLIGLAPLMIIFYLQIKIKTMNRVKLKIGNIEASASGDSYVSGALTFGIGFGGLGLAGWGLVNLLKGAGNAIVNIGATILGAIATGWALNHAEKKEEQHETKKTEKLEESKVESKDVESVSNSVENDSCNIEESSLEDVVYSVPSADFKPLVRDLITAGGIYILSGSTGTGKSIMGGQLGLDIATGEPSKLVAGDSVHAPQKVLFFDGELSNQDWANRYGNMTSIPKNFTRLAGQFDSCDKFLGFLETKVKGTETDVTVIIDNLTACILQELTASKVNELYSALKNIQEDALKNGKLITFFLIVHPVKDYDEKNRMKLSDINGSHRLSSFATGVFALSSTDEDDVKIMYELKRRRKGMKKEVRLKRVDYPYVHFELIDDEQDLSDVSEEDFQNVQSQQQSNCGSANTKHVSPDIAKMMDLRNAGKTDDEIAADMKCSRQTVYRKIGPKNPKT